MEIGEKLKEFGQKNFSTMKAFADALGMKPPSLYQYFGKKAKRKPGAGILKRLQDLGCDIDWLLKGSSQIKYIKEPEINYIKPELELPLMAQVPAGIGEIKPLSEWIQKKIIDTKESFLLKVDDDCYSMMPIIKPGDYVLVSNRDFKFKDGDIVAARWDKIKGAIKIISFSKDTKEWMRLNSTNPSVQSIFLKRNEVQLYKILAWFDSKIIK